MEVKINILIFRFFLKPDPNMIYYLISFYFKSLSRNTETFEKFLYISKYIHMQKCYYITRNLIIKIF